jgi:signal transduction histidine kinase/ABC-type amino acid transport substrate-binding protein/FixJ family two-component response regulator
MPDGSQMMMAEKIRVAGRSAAGRFLLLLLAVILFTAYLPAAAYAQTKTTEKTVKVAYYSDGDYMGKTRNGEYKGYNIEYLYEIAAQAGWKYKFVDYDSWEDAMKGLDKGEYDIMPALFKTKERQARYRYSSEDMGSVYVTLIVRSDDSTRYYDDIDSFQGMKVAMIRGSEDSKSFLDWAQSQGLKTRNVYYRSTEALLGALDDKKVDAVAVTYLGNSTNYRVVAEFDPMKLYFVTPKSDKAIMEELDSAMRQCTLTDPTFENKLYDKYLSTSRMQKPVFSKAEESYIRKREPVTVVLTDNNMPFSMKSSDGSARGVVPDMFKTISRMCGLKFSYSFVSSQGEAMEAVKKGKADVIGMMEDNSIVAVPDNIILMKAYATLSLSRITKKNKTDISSISTIAMPDKVAEAYANIAEERMAAGKKVVYYNSGKECFDALKSNAVDAVFVTSAEANYIMNQNRANAYTVTPMSSYTYSIAAGTGDDEVMLHSILEKCFRYTTVSTFDSLMLKDTLSGEHTLSASFNRLSSTALLIILLVLLALVLALAGFIVMLRRSHRERLLAHEKEVELMAAEKTNEAKSEFLSSLSHDMRTPLNGIIGFTNLALQSDDAEVRKKYLEKAGEAEKLLLSLINDSLEFTRTEDGRIQVFEEAVDTRELIESIRVPISEQAKTRNVEFVIDADGCKPGVVIVDKIKIEKILLNLLSNSVKFTPEGGHVTLGIRMLEPPQGRYNCRVTVADDGIGISEEFLPYIFEPFRQERSAKDKNSSGTGLGLSIVKRLTDLIGASISVESEKGRGTKFTIDMEVRWADDGQLQDKAGCLPESLSLDGMRILLVEDNAMNTEIARTILEEKGARVRCAADGREGVSVFTAAPENYYDLILMDLRMPTMNGFEATKAIRALPRADASSVPVIAMSADAFHDDIVKCLEVGMNAHIAKPLDPDKMFRTIFEVLKSAEESGPEQKQDQPGEPL